MVEFMLDTAAEQTAAFAFDEFAVKGPGTENHPFRADHRSIERRYRETAFLPFDRFSRGGENFRIDGDERHTGQQQHFAGGHPRRGFRRRHFEDDQSERFPDLRGGDADAVEGTHREQHFGGEVADRFIHRQNRSGDFGQNRIADGAYRADLMSVKEHG